ncbi:MAG: PilZ domain-containing protein [Hyphomicrobiaceae bacterium]
MESQEVMALKGQERRTFGRRNLRLRGRIAWADHRPLLCWIDNISLGGALLTFPERVWTPFQFTLIVDGFNERFACEIRHHGEDRLGVAFQSGDASRLIQSAQSECPALPPNVATRPPRLGFEPRVRP